MNTVDIFKSGPKIKLKYIDELLIFMFVIFSYCYIIRFIVGNNNCTAFNIRIGRIRLDINEII